MTNFVQTANAAPHGMFRKAFQTRDIFLHDGKTLRRIKVGAPVQFAAVFVAAFLVFWSIFAAAQLSTTPPVAMPEEVARMEQQVQAMQADVQAIRQVAEQRYQLTERAVRQLGLNPNRFQGAAAQGKGGPFEAVQPLQSADPRFRQLFMSWRQLDQLEQGVIAIPSMKPVSDANFTSGYGVRSDPFRRGAAMHAGIDLAGPVGTPIYATADGIIARSEVAGAYGNLVEINHGQGIQTRYGHMSRRVAAVGQRVRRGELIGLMGSTGRSTGSHLHYEVRVDGRAVNPVPFMQSNDYLAAVQRRASLGTPTAVGGPTTASR